VGYLRDIAREPYGWKHEHQRQWTLRAPTTGKRVLMGTLLVWTGERIFGLNNDQNQIFCTPRKGKQIWTMTTPEGSCPKAIVRAGDKVLVAAMPDEKDVTRGEVWILSAEDGSKLGQVALPAAPRFDGMAVIAGKVVVTTQDGRVVCLSG